LIHEMDNELGKVVDRAKYTPEEAALLMRLSVFVNMRWLAILGIIAATVAASLVFHVGFPTIPVYIICVFLALYNLVFLYQTQRLGREKTGLVVARARTYGYVHIFLDLIALTILIHFTGGIENPFIFLFVLHAIVSGIVLPYRTAYIVTTLAFLMVVVLVGLEYTGIISHVNLEGFVLPYRYQQTSRVLSFLVALALILYASTYLTTALSEELRKRQRQVLELSEQFLKEKVEELDVSSMEIVKLQKEKERFLFFIGVASHDLKAPLAAIQSYIGVMLGGFSGEVNEKQKNMLERSSYRITELLRLISDLLDIPRIESGQIVQEMKDISLNQTINDCLVELQRLADEKDLRLEVDLPETIPIIRGSSPRLQQVITNLLNNAISYTPQGGIITLRVTVVDKGTKVEVSDTGIGIPPVELSRAFEDFFRGSNVETKGTGLGLSITKRIVEAHGGRIWIESPCPGRNNGSSVTFILPNRN
jgi:signal transduction histidine kinase